ncbi:hypothetical protein [Methylopila sp. M107]|uniref:hypothetical protein n=1 Tax=Methylopila sp. M107 TaxID=1101190 RepID=UPI00035FBD77|nr:hypothetical protein [Methylopila sp. M107]
MSSPDVSPPPAPAPGFARHLGRIALVCLTLLAASFVGALVAAFAHRSASPFAAALDRADDVSEPLIVFAAAAALFAGLRAALGEGLARRRKLVALRRRARRWGWIVHLLWIPALLVVVFAEGGTLLFTLVTPIIIAGILWVGSVLSAHARRGGRLTYGLAAVVGLAIGLFA